MTGPSAPWKASAASFAAGRRRAGKGRLAVLALAPLLLAAACTTTKAVATGGTSASASQSAAQGTTSGKGGAHRPARPPSALTIVPADGSTNVATDQVVTARMAHGTVVHISVSSAGTPVEGAMGSGGTWRSTWALGVAQSYTVTATGVNTAGKTTTETSTFRTLTPAQTFQTQIFEGYDLSYGVGMPIQLDFTQPIVDEAAVERSLQITTSKPVVGAWYWNGDQEVDFRPETYWPSGTTVSFVGHFDGVEAAPGLYGFHTLTQTFRIGPSLIVVASTLTHYMDVYSNGTLLYHWPISTGRPGLDTPDGTYLTMAKANPQLMVGPGYSLEVPWSVRFTYSGDFLHDAYWSVYEQGSINVSHGCVNMPPADAEIYYNMAIQGDPVTIVGSPLAGKWGDGWTEWFLTWDQIVQGSALGEAVEAGPHGSVFVNPATLPHSHAAAPLTTSPANNSAATV
jgi:lipoprotein-anchoring transpeptidase ErfK/SrfK